MLPIKDKPLSIYIHWPFCLSLCPYCDFNSHLNNNIDHKSWLKSYLQEIDYFANHIQNREIVSIFFGGGTPSLMEPFVVGAIIEHLANIGIVSDQTEITLEANPTSYEAKKFADFNASGVNRVSLGVQALVDDDLQALGRNHSAKQAINAIKSARSIFPRYSFDLIYARPNQTMQQWQRELKEAVQLAEGHISLYQLTIEKGTPFFSLFKKGELILPEDSIAADMYEWTTNYLASEHGYHRYEISNYATPGQECRHNLTYWWYNEYLGIGPGSHSRLHHNLGEVQLHHNISEIDIDATSSISKLATPVTSLMMTYHPQKWQQQVSALGVGVQKQQPLALEEIIEEMLMMNLRLASGARQEEVHALTGKNFIDIIDFSILDQYVKQDLVIFSGDQISLTDKGLLLHNYIVPRLLLPLKATQ